MFAIVLTANVCAAEVAPASPQEASKRLLLSKVWEARVWGPFGKGRYTSVKCEERGSEIFCAYSGGTRNQEIRYEVLSNGELKTTTTRGVPVTLTPKGDGFETLSSEAGIRLTPAK
jgi:hypothetical protein